MKKKSYPLASVYTLIEPGPVVLVSTHYGGKDNIMTMAWHMMIEFEPPLIGCVISNRNYSFDMLVKSKECVINIPAIELLETAVSVGSCHGSRIDKFKKFGLTRESGSVVSAPLIKECFANLECKVVDTKLVEKYNIFILEVVHAWKVSSQKRQRTFHHCGKGLFAFDGKLVKTSWIHT